MKCMKAIVLPVLAGWLLMGACGSLRAQAITAETSLSRHLVMAASFVRETQDQEWRLRITGRLPTPPGMYAIVYNEAGDLVCHGAIAAGDYSPEKPFTLTVPKDGLAQQYVIKLLGVNANFDAVTLPMTDLPFEVYGGRGDSIFVMPYPARGQIRRLAFQVNPAASNVLFFGAANMSVSDTNGVVLAETRSDKAELVPKTGQIYWLDPGNANQITVKGGEKIYFTFDPERWFYPSITWDLESRPWWKGLRKQ